MNKTPLDIHPIDLGLLLSCDPDPGEFVLKDGKWKNELFEYNGKLYRPTVEEPEYKAERRIELLESYLAAAKSDLKAGA